MNRIKTIREELGATQTAVATAAGMLPQHWCALEKRSQESLRGLPYASLERFARALGCTVADLLEEGKP